MNHKKLTCRNLLKTLGLGATLLALIGCAARKPCTEPTLGPSSKPCRPNILLILADDMGYADPACFGNSHVKTPHIDRLCREGVKLTDCYAASTVCSPARTGILTGRVPHRCGVYDWISDAEGHNFMHLPRSEVTIAQILQKAGYATGIFGKWHLNGRFNSPDQPTPEDFGFDEWFASGQNLKRQRNPFQFIHNGKPVSEREGFACEVVADEAIRWIENVHQTGKPFYQCLWFHEPHAPIDAPKETVEQYKDHEGTKPYYYANVTNLDRQIGRVLTKIDELGLRDNTFVLFTSDNGPAKLSEKGYLSRSHGSAGPYREYKWALYEGGIRVPGIIRWPGHAKPGQICTEPVSGVDLLPTLCAIVGQPVPADRVIDGADFASIFDGRPVQREIPLHWHYSSSYVGPQAVMREGDFIITGDWNIPHPVKGRFVRDTIAKIKTANLIDFRLYHIRQDPGQTTDLSSKEPERFKKMKARLIQLHQEVHKEAPTWGRGTMMSREIKWMNNT